MFHPNRNRGRRVSFGVIHAIPSVDGVSGHNSPAGNVSPSPLTMCTMSNRQATAPPESTERCQEESHKEREGSERVVENVVDEMLQRAIDEVMVTD